MIERAFTFRDCLKAGVSAAAATAPGDYSHAL